MPVPLRTSMVAWIVMGLTVMALVSTHLYFRWCQKRFDDMPEQVRAKLLRNLKVVMVLTYVMVALCGIALSAVFW